MGTFFNYAAIFHKLVIDLIKSVNGLTFLAEGLDNRMACIHFFDMAIQIAESFLLSHKIGLRTGCNQCCYKKANGQTSR